jgi:4-amino-4-deoxy-L-arabinose transferase-like glycosyltransferase
MMNWKENRYTFPLLLFVMALAVRLSFLGRADLWCDEILFVWLSTPPQSPWTVIVNQWDKLLTVTHLPFPEVVQNVLLWLCRPLFADGGHHPFIQRLPAAIWGALTIPVFYRLSRRLLSGCAQFGATLMICFFIFPVYYSREAYYYAPLMFCSTSALLILLETVDGEPLILRRGILFGLAATGMVYSHLTGTVLALLMLVGAGVLWLTLRLTNKPVATPVKKITAWCALPLLAVSPWIFRLASNPSACNTVSGTPVQSILYDAAGKFFMGSLPAWNIAACLLFAAGAVALAWPGKQAASRRLLLGLLVSGVLVLAVSAHKTQYHVRYFSVLTPAIYLTLAAGLYSLTKLIFRRFAPVMFTVVLSVLILIQAVIYLPPYYRLTAKSVDFGGIARWINANVNSGAPYLMESAYELRFVSGYFPAPGKTGASPYTHSGGPGELDRLHESQQKFMQRFPEAPFIESAHHNSDQPDGVWKWPKQFHAQHIQLRNEPLRSLIRLGIYPGAPHETVTDYSYITDIYYSTPADIAQKARERGDTAIFRWTGWTCSPYAQDPRTRIVEYGWAAPGTAGKLVLENLSGTPVKGRVQLDLAVAASPGTVDVYLRLPQGTPVSFRRSAGQFQMLESSEIEIPADGINLETGVMGARATSVQGILIRDAQFIGSGVKN